MSGEVVVSPELLNEQSESGGGYVTTVVRFVPCRWWVSLCGLLAIAAIPQMLTLSRFPAPFVDEAWLAARGVGLLHTGYGFGVLDAGVLDRYSGYEHYFWWLGPWLHSLIIGLAGVNLTALRAESLLFGIALLVVVYAHVRGTIGHRAGLFSVAIGAISFPFTFSTHLARQDVILAFLGFGASALALYDTGRDRWPWKAGLAGLAIVAGLELHPNVIIFVPVVASLYLIQHGRAVLKSRSLWIFGGIGLVGAMAFVALHVLPNPGTYATIARLQNGEAHNPPLISPDLWRWATEGTFWLVGAVAWIIVTVSMLDRVLSKTWTQGYTKLVVLFWVNTTVFTAIVSNRPEHYAVLLAPPVWALAGALLERTLNAGVQGRRLALLRVGLVVGLILSPIVGTTQALTRDESAEYRVNADYVRTQVTGGKSAIGVQTWWFARTTEPYISWEQIVYYRRSAPGSSLEEAMRFLHPDYIIVDDTVRLYLVDDIDAFRPNIASSLVNRAEFERFLDVHGRIVEAPPPDTSAHLRIYKVEW